MREVIQEIDQWQAEGEEVALATVLETWGSAPREVGAKMALTPGGRIAGSVSGGCVEGAVFEAGIETIDDGQPQLLSFGVADEMAWDVGLACGGQIEVFVERVDERVHEATRRLLEADRPGAIVTVIQGAEKELGAKLALGREGILAGDLPAAIREEALAAARETLASGRTQRLTLGEMELFIEAVRPAPVLVIVGGVHIAIALASMARTVGYRTVVVDPRRAFGSQERFAHADRLIQKWPEKAFAEIQLTSSTAVVMLTHDPKIDDPALTTVLGGPAFYVGALGSTRTHARRKERLGAAGLTQSQIERIHAPIGLDISARTPEEIAVAIMAEIIKVRRQR